jgi:hypothetical protein
VSDWVTDRLDVEVDSHILVKPPVWLLVGTVAIAAVSCASARWDSQWGYLIAVLASILGGFTALQDQKRRGHPSYVMFGWWQPSLRAVRYAVLAVALLHVALLAIDASRGGGIVGRLIFAIFT